MKCVEEISAGKPVKEDDLLIICRLPDSSSSSGQFYTTLRSHLLQMKDYPLMSLLTVKGKSRKEKSLKDIFDLCLDVDTAEVRRLFLPTCHVSMVCVVLCVYHL